MCAISFPRFNALSWEQLKIMFPNTTLFFSSSTIMHSMVCAALLLLKTTWTPDANQENDVASVPRIGLQPCGHVLNFLLTHPMFVFYSCFRWHIVHFFHIWCFEIFCPHSPHQPFSTSSDMAHGHFPFSTAVANALICTDVPRI